MTTRKQVTVVIVTYQSRRTIEQALASLEPSVEEGFVDCVVVDNASPDGTADYVAASFPWANLIRSPQNLGFGRGCNLGSESVTTPYIMFLNPDASIDQASLHTLVEFMEVHESAGIAGPATFETTACIFQPVGMLLTPMGLIRGTLRLPGAYPERRTLESGEAPYRTNWVCGSSMIVRTSMFREIEGFDPRFFLYYEETDLCLRASRAGYEIWTVGTATARHIGAASAKQSGAELTTRKSGGSIVEYFYPSRFYYLSKNFGWLSAVAAESITRAVEWLRWIAKTILRRSPSPSERPAGRPFLRFPAPVDDSLRRAAQSRPR
jgi:N-acetylglucosaminyl-diphospho-decaprenol L-rhamnosyltransferase